MTWRILILFTFYGFIFISCDRRSDYQKLLDRELASGERHDTLFYGLSLGMTSKEFFEQCYNKNQEGLFFQSGATVEYKMEKELPFPATMNFYPEFQDAKIIEMPVTFSYESWAPWNKRASVDSLQVDLKNLFEKWYGTGFIRTEHPERGVAFVKIDGNRRIVIVKQDDKTAKVLFTDMSVEKKETQPAQQNSPTPSDSK
ncbi:MAG: hypothetical protein SFU99_14815 [Saprospiraceae bacterium]|nr:hypothetical protein [Saprospiraceae bacterium]